MKAKWLVLTVALVVVCGWLGAMVYAADAPAGTAAPGHKCQPILTPEQRAVVKPIIAAARPELKALRADVRTEVQKLRDLRKNKAADDAITAQKAVVKTKVEALKARVGKLEADVKAVLPADVYQKWLDRRHQMMEKFKAHHGRGAHADHGPGSAKP